MRKRLLQTGLAVLLAALGLGASALATTPSDQQYTNPIVSEQAPPPATEQPPTLPTEQPALPTEQPTLPGEQESTPPSGVAGASASEEGPGVVEAATGALPFTGFQAGLVLIGGLALAATGFALRRIGRNRNT